MKNVCAIVVTYHPDEAVWPNLAAIRRQVDRVVVVDNSADAVTAERLSTLAAEGGYEVILNPENLGIAAALNAGAARAIARGYEWLATFDQDSRVPDGFVATLLGQLAAFPNRDRVAIVSPLYVDRFLGTVSSPSMRLNGGLDEAVPVRVTASSGNLVRARAFEALGGLRADFFIDCVDFEFCLRARRAGWLVLEARKARLEHAQGRAERRKLLWRRPVVNDYPAERRYYQARNRLILIARYATFDPSWIFRDAFGYTCDTVKMLLFCRERPRKIRAMLRGVAHAFTGRRGRLAP
jgi:rhamnosyltransferase